VFAALRNEVDIRLLAVQQSLIAIARVEADAAFPADVSKTLKGLVFVQLYAVYEYCVTTSVQTGIRAVNSSNLALRDLRHELLSLALDDGCRSLADCGASRTWDVRLNLMARTRSSDPVQAPETVFPADGTHYRVGQLSTIWSLFGIVEPCVPDNRFIGRIDELVELRNGIAHGRMTAEDVGSRFSLTDLQSRHGDTKALCEHVVTVVEGHVTDIARLKA